MRAGEYRDGVKLLEPSLELPFSEMKSSHETSSLKKKKKETDQEVLI